jgi:cytochrome c oxidase subunit IV
LSFVANLMLGQNINSASVILVVAIIKATLVAGIFMHLKFDWGKLYCIILPVCVVTVMMVIILSIDAALAWHAYPDSAVPLIQ